MNLMKTLVLKKRHISEHSETSARSRTIDIRARTLHSSCQFNSLATIRVKHTPKDSYLPRSERSYNKWFIPPKDRMKRNAEIEHFDKKKDSYIYLELYRDRLPDPISPFKDKVNEKLKLLEFLHHNNLNTLQNFRKNQLARKKRVPQIVEMLTRRSKNKSSLA